MSLYSTNLGDNFVIISRARPRVCVLSHQSNYDPIISDATWICWRELAAAENFAQSADSHKFSMSKYLHKLVASRARANVNHFARTTTTTKFCLIFPYFRELPTTISLCVCVYVWRQLMCVKSQYWCDISWCFELFLVPCSVCVLINTYCCQQFQVT